MYEYKQIYKSIEDEVLELSYSVSLSEEQASTYSPKIADLILRSASLLESLIKFRYQEVNGKTDRYLKYDGEDVIESLAISEVCVFIHWDLYNFDKRLFRPFVKNEERVDKIFNNVGKVGSDNYGWNNAYQSLRHQFINSIKHYGNLSYLFETLAAAYSVLEGDSSIFMMGEISEDGSTFEGWVPGRTLTRASYDLV